ncbi:VOC family protein [Subsaxibacter sp. CAU 1640]|uniref:VOC family protein n=1 Tax=Subsaxibacter sp. CAU 1640 TaxID=2933271 RepID=UPI002003B796|nr:VOC family protein [Subsaxibacter sp. CAU 1640]MCK7591412.1 VOC family protein [Subsaxibacter sp. CAU 1640]
MEVQAYLAFRGNCQEALNYYGELFNAEVRNKQTYEGKNIDVPENYRNKLQHAELRGKGVSFMAYDAAPDTPLNNGNQIHMSIDVKEKNEAENLFNKLSNGGQVQQKFAEQEWGHFGRCSDKFGINWMVNCNS